MSNSINAKAVQDVFRLVLKSKGAIQAVTKEILKEIPRRLVNYSAFGDPSLWSPPYWPKGYTPGHFINNWQLGVDTMPANELPGTDSVDGIAAIARMHKSIPRWPVGHTYYFVNNAPYAALLESGLHSSQVGPGGMVALTVLEYPQIARQAEINYSKAN